LARLRAVILDIQPYCGAELLPHATAPDGSPAPILCTRPLHGLASAHRNEENGVCWRWQDMDGAWLSGTSGAPQA
jgi:hypothetical protein